MLASIRLTMMLPLLIVSVAGSRLKTKVQSSIEEESSGECSRVQKPVNLLVTRHGVSCANLVDKFSSSWIASKLHTVMSDPLLCSAGQKTTVDAGVGTKAWLDKKGVNIDAVMGSHLARAMETAALQYPGYEVLGVPYVSESGFGMDNKPKPLEEQRKNLQDAVKDLNLNTAWMEKYGKTKGSWDTFLQSFLANDYLPSKYGDQTESSAEAATMSVVTHSNFMKEGDIYKRCGRHYPIDAKENKRKATNNMVVILPYIWETEICPNQTVIRHILPDHRRMLPDGSYVDSCEVVFNGTSLYDVHGKNKRLCNKDVGTTCFNEFEEGAVSSTFGIKPDVPTIEEDLQQLNDEQKRKRIQSDALKEQRRVLEEQKSSAQSDEWQDQLAQRISYNVKRTLALEQKMARVHKQFDEFRQHQCWVGGSPDHGHFDEFI